MTTFRGQAVLVGTSSSPDVKKYVEIFDEQSRTWALKTPEDGYGLRYTANFALIALENKLLHLGGLDTGEGKLHYHSQKTFLLDSMFTEWKPFGDLTLPGTFPGTAIPGTD